MTQPDVYQCVDSFSGPKVTKQWNWGGTCGSGTHTGCYRYKYGSGTANQTRLDQRGITGYQVTFPRRELNLWHAFRFDDMGGKSICVAGGAHVGRNPLSMTWSGHTGSKSRKNNFISFKAGGSGMLHVEGVRVHNNHDPFYTNRAHIRNSWISWNRDDIIEADLFGIRISDTLIDGTYTFLSDRDGGCPANRDASDKTLIIENSLIRLQPLPGPSAAQPNGLRHHWRSDGGHGGLWKHNNCNWNKWPKFELRNNIFFVESPGLNRWRNVFDTSETEFGLPSALDSNLLNVTKCENNIFLYTNYDAWTAAGTDPGAIPKPGGKFYNSSNPNYLQNGSDCYQRVTDDPSDPGYGDVMSIWRAARDQWIARHTGSSDPKQNVMMIPGVDYSVLQAGQSYQLRNKATGQCVQRGGNGDDATLASCNRSAAQLWVAEARSDGKLRGAVLLRNKSSGGYLRSQDESVIVKDGNDNQYDPDVFWVSNSSPNFRERWYVYPLGGEPGGEANTYAIESDALRRSFIFANGNQLQVQLLYKDGENTALPQNSPALAGRDDARLQWYIEPR